MEKNQKLAEKYNPKDFEESLYNEWEKTDILSQVWIKQKNHIQ